MWGGGEVGVEELRGHGWRLQRWVVATGEKGGLGGRDMGDTGNPGDSQVPGSRNWVNVGVLKRPAKNASSAHGGPVLERPRGLDRVLPGLQASPPGLPRPRPSSPSSCGRLICACPNLRHSAGAQKAGDHCSLIGVFFHSRNFDQAPFLF